MLSRIQEKVAAGERLDRADGHWLLSQAPLLDLGSLAQEARFRRIPEKQVTFVIDTNPNYTNVCITDCQFCAFYRKPGDPASFYDKATNDDVGGALMLMMLADGTVYAYDPDKDRP